VYQPVIKPLAIKYIVSSKSILLVVILLLLNVSVFAQKTSQKRKQLENERKTLLARIGETKKVIAENKEKENTKLTELKAINAQIKTREKVINNIGQEIFEISVEVNESKTTIDTLKVQLARLKKDYANNMVAIYKNKNNLNDLAFIFNSEGFNDAYKRIKYLDKLSEYKQLQARLIVNIQKSIEDEINNMLQVKKQSEQLYTVKEVEKKELEVDKKVETKVLTGLQQKQKVLQEEQAQNERNFQKLSQKISDLIQKEIEDARRREEERRRIANEKSDVERAKLIAENKKKGIETKPETKKVPESTLSPDDLLTNTNFENMKNRLPWPVNNGYIAEGFGTHQHPTLKAVYTTNNGINIACKKETTVRSVFKGKVKAIFEVPGMEKIILVKHGEYFTVYAKLENVQVKIGQEINVGEVLGKVFTFELEQKTEIHFEIFKGKKALNPEAWLKN
jgi:septal ring factor EnvC (AmiA/AmiB activator)